MALSKVKRKKIYDKMNRLKGSSGRKKLANEAKKAFRRGDKKLSRGLWALHSKKSAYAAGVRYGAKNSTYKKRR